MKHWSYHKHDTNVWYFSTWQKIIQSTISNIIFNTYLEYRLADALSMCLSLCRLRVYNRSGRKPIIMCIISFYVDSLPTWLEQGFSNIKSDGIKSSASYHAGWLFVVYLAFEKSLEKFACSSIDTVSNLLYNTFHYLNRL